AAQVAEVIDGLHVQVFPCSAGRGGAARDARAPGRTKGRTGDTTRARVRTGTRARVMRRQCSEPLADVAGEVHHALGEAPLVVVPRDNLHLVADHPGHTRVVDARGRVAGDVGGDQRVLGVDQDA